MRKRAIVQRPKRKLAKATHGVEHVRMKVRKDGSEEISIFGPDVQDTQDQQTYSSRKSSVDKTSQAEAANKGERSPLEGPLPKAQSAGPQGSG